MAALHPCTTRIRRGARPPSYTTLWGTTHCVSRGRAGSAKEIASSSSLIDHCMNNSVLRWEMEVHASFGHPCSLYQIVHRDPAALTCNSSSRTCDQRGAGPLRAFLRLAGAMLDILLLRSLLVDNRHVTLSPLRSRMGLLCTPIAPRGFGHSIDRRLTTALTGNSPFYKV